MSRFWSPLVHRLAPYVPGEQPKTNVIKLNTNENPYGPSPSVLEAIKAEASVALRLYPDPNADCLRSTIARYFRLSANQVFLGNGSDEVLAHAFQALLKQDAPLLFPDVTYGFYSVYCGLYDIEYHKVPLTETLEIDVNDYRQICGGIIFPNPNAPTGCLLGLEQIESLLLAQPDRVLVVDEAYIDFGGQSAIPLVSRYPNLLVVQTLSKSRSLAGLRVGFAIGNPELIEALDRVKNSFNSYPLDRLAIAGAIASFEDEAHFKYTCHAVIGTREELIWRLRRLGFEIPTSFANFVLARHPEHDAGELFAGLRERGIVVRHFRQPRIDQYLRITIGTDAECETLVQALAELVAA